MKALLVIDVQRGMFAHPASQPYNGEEVVARIAGLIDAARIAGALVIFVQHDGGAGDPLDGTSPGFDLRPEVAPAPGEPVLVKRVCSAFQGTGLAELLDARGVDAVTLCGMQTEFCVDTTARVAFERGLRVTLASDAHTTVDGEAILAEMIVKHHNTTLRDGGFVTLEPAANVEF